jgi:ADP-ribose diphosphatase
MKKFERGKLLNRKIVYSGRIVELVVDDIEIKGKKTLREVVHHPGGVGILAEVEPDRISLVRQHRYPLDRDVLEIPAGKIESGEEPERTAIRELEEETGYRPLNIKPAFSYYPTPGYCDELLHIFYVNSVEKTCTCFDEDEELEIEFYKLDETLAMIREGKIKDGKTIAALYWLALDRNKIQ